MQIDEGRPRVVVEGVKPEVDGGRYPIKRIVGETVVVEADIYTDRYDTVSAVLLFRPEYQPTWQEAPLVPLVNDRWRGVFTLTDLGWYRYTIQGWIDTFRTWREGLKKKVAVSQDVAIDLLVGSTLLEQASQRATTADAARLRQWAQVLAVTSARQASYKLELALGDALADVMNRYPDRRFATTYDKELGVMVERDKARFSTWYEMFPRSWATEPGRHGAFKDCETWLPYIAEMGFDVLYLPPIHPIGRTYRKGKNNAAVAAPDDVGCPWAIGAKEGGHKAIHPALGTLADFQRLLDRAREYGIEIALDIALHCSPDHPYVTEHPEWFQRRPDGTVQCAENPPNLYHDIYPFAFETADWKLLWEELKSIFLFWIEQGVRIFRVDNPHTKPFLFWTWCIEEVKTAYPDVILLAEAFTRPKLMYRLSKLGFTQSYTYFIWRNTKEEFIKYFTELTQTEVREFFLPNLWPNTPDVLPEHLQSGGRPAFMIRLVLAATLGANYGIYGPAFELCVSVSQRPGSEAYLDSEQYEIRHWNLAHPESLKTFIARVNSIRKAHRALQCDWCLHFHATDNAALLCYSKNTEDLTDCLLMIVTLDPHRAQAGWIHLDLDVLGLDPKQAYQVHDLLTDNSYRWYGARHYVKLTPQVIPAYIFHIRCCFSTYQPCDMPMNRQRETVHVTPTAGCTP